MELHTYLALRQYFCISMAFFVGIINKFAADLISIRIYLIYNNFYNSLSDELYYSGEDSEENFHVPT
jgi:hypothetical protein